MEIINHKGKYYLKTETGYSEVLATTDTSLKIDNPNYDIGRLAYINLPQPSQQFIEKYIEEYNKGQQITECLVEYEEIYPKHFTYNPNENIITRLKVDKNNTITIKKVKDSYTREEVENLIYSAMKDRCYTTIAEWKKWIEENL